MEFAYALFLQGDYEQAKRHLDRLANLDLGIRAPDRNLLDARTLEQMGDLDAALIAYEKALSGSRGEETHCRYAALLEKAGRADEAKRVYEDILRRARRAPGHYRRAEREWISTAQRALYRIEHPS